MRTINLTEEFENAIDVDNLTIEEFHNLTNAELEILGHWKISDLKSTNRDLLMALNGLLEILACECDNTHKNNSTVCRYCWAKQIAYNIKVHG